MMEEIVPDAPDPDPGQQEEERDVTAHQDYSKEAVAVATVAEIQEAISELQPLRERISKLLGPAGPHRVVVRGDAGTGQRCLAFIETELAILVPFLTTLGLQHWPSLSTALESLLCNVSLVDQLLHAVTRCFFPRCFFFLCRTLNLFWFLPATLAFYRFNEGHLFRYRPLLLTSSNHGLTPQLAETGALLPLVSIHRPAKKIMRWLTQQGNMDMSLRVMSIAGPVGIGKTTLALEVHNRFIRHETSSGGRQYFHCNVISQASRGAHRKILLLQDILSQVSDPAGPALSSDESQCNTVELLLPLVSERLQHKRYFITIDDLWKKSDWEEIKGAFPNNNLGSRILITTRVTSVAEACCSSSSDGLVYKMKPLTEIESERLLLSKAVGCEDGFLPDTMKNDDEDGDEDDEEHQRFPFDWVQASSNAFNDFPNDNLRLLLLYMSMFPYGYKFEKDRLILKWIEEGFIVMTGQLAKSEAETFFSQLVDRNVITCVASNCKHKQDEAEDCQWQVNHCMQQFLASKSAEMGFFFTTTTLNLVASAAAHHCNEASSRMPRRLTLHHPIPQLPSLLGTLDLSQTRSLSVSGTVGGIPVWDSFANLVVLDLEGWENLKDEDLVQVCRSKMIFLTYLSVRNTQVSKLPHEVKELLTLGILDVSYTQITELPLKLFELTYLEHLDLRGTRIRQLPKQILGLQHALEVLLVGGEGTINSVETATRLPHEVEHLYCLRTLATVDLTQHPASFVRALGDLEDLRVLAVIWSFHQSTDRDYYKALLSSIEKWRSLECLSIHCGLGCSMEFLGSLKKSHAPRRLEKFKVTAGRFPSVPPWIDGLEHLAFVQITIYNNKETTTDDLKILEALPKLQCLILGLDFITGQLIVIGNEGFQELLKLSLDCPMPWLTFQTGAMPLLTHLKLKFSSGPTSEERVPSGISNLRRISEVDLSYSKWCANSTTVKMTVKAVREQVAKHRNPIDLFINGVEDDDVQAVDEEAANATGTSSSATDAGPRRDNGQAVHEKVTVVAQTEITEDES